MRIFIFITLTVTLLSISCTDIEPAQRVADNFYILQKKYDYTSIKKMLSAEFTSVTAADKFTRHLDSIKNIKGEIKSFIVQDFDIQTKNNITIATFCYRVRYENDISSDTLVFIKDTTDDYKILLFKQNFLLN